MKIYFLKQYLNQKKIILSQLLLFFLGGQVKKGEALYPKDFTAENRVVGVLWSTKRDSSLWFGPKEWKECRLGIQLLPILPVSEIL